MPCIGRMGDDFVLMLNGELIRFQSYDAAYRYWEEHKDD